MVEPALIVSAVGFSIIILFIAVVILIYYGHPDDKNSAWIPKIITVLGLWLAICSVMVLPYDVANSRGSGGGININVLWYIIYCSLAVLVCCVIPFAFFYYESSTDEQEQNRLLASIHHVELNRENQHGLCDGQMLSAIKFTAGFAIIFIILVVIMYSFLNQANLPVNRVAQSVYLVQPLTGNYTAAGSPACVAAQGCVTNNFNWVVPVTFPIYLMAFLAFIGWFFFAVFVGVGLAALPMDLIAEFRSRPRPISTREYFEKRMELSHRAWWLWRKAQLIQESTMHGESRSFMQKQRDEIAIRKLERLHYFLNKDTKQLHTSYRHWVRLRSREFLVDLRLIAQRRPPLGAYAKLFAGIVSTGISISWFVHIWIFILPRRPINPFLNTFFVDLEQAFGKGSNEFGFFGVIAFAIWSLYLLACCINGNFKLGVRFVFFSVYPMEINNTLMNAFLFNTWIILLCSVPCVQFCAFAFPIYVRYTAIDLLFGTQIKYLTFFRYFWANNIFVWAMVCVTMLSLVWLSACPRDVGKNVREEIEDIRADPKQAERR